MKSLFLVLSCLMILLTFSHPAKAEGECDKYSKAYDKTYCFAKLFLESDKELNDVYKDIKALLPDDIKSQLTQTQRDWMAYRDATCSSGGTINVSCNFKANRDRTDYLRDRLRECKAGTCRNDMIVQKSWN